jgi:hypothetical protein
MIQSAELCCERPHAMPQEDRWFFGILFLCDHRQVEDVLGKEAKTAWPKSPKWSGAALLALTVCASHRGRSVMSVPTRTVGLPPITSGLSVIRPESPAFAEEPSNFQKQTTCINIDSDMLPMSGRWAVGRSDELRIERVHDRPSMSFMSRRIRCLQVRIAEAPRALEVVWCGRRKSPSDKIKKVSIAPEGLACGKTPCLD